MSKLKDVNGYKAHNLQIIKPGRNGDNDLIYIVNPLESKVPRAYLTLNEFKDALTNRVRNKTNITNKINTNLMPLKKLLRNNKKITTKEVKSRTIKKSLDSVSIKNSKIINVNDKELVEIVANTLKMKAYTKPNKKVNNVINISDNNNVSVQKSIKNTNVSSITSTISKLNDNKKLINISNSSQDIITTQYQFKTMTPKLNEIKNQNISNNNSQKLNTNPYDVPLNTKITERTTIIPILKTNRNITKNISEVVHEITGNIMNKITRSISKKETTSKKDDTIFNSITNEEITTEKRVEIETEVIKTDLRQNNDEEIQHSYESEYENEEEESVTASTKVTFSKKNTLSVSIPS